MSLIATIDCDRFVKNILAIKEKTKTNIIAIVKADAYGHGASILAKVAEPYVDSFAVIDIIATKSPFLNWAFSIYF